MPLNDRVASDPEVPLWFRILNLEDSQFEQSKYADVPVEDSAGKFRLKDIDILRKLDPDEYQAAVDSVSAYNKQLADTRNGKRNYKTGRLLCSIPAKYMALNPELGTDPKALDSFLLKHPELKTRN